MSIRAVVVWVPIALALLGVGATGCSSGESDEGASTEEIAVIRVANQGELRLRFYPDTAPKHVENFKKLARAGFYDGTTFHRVIPGFMIQGGDILSKDGDPSNDGRGGPGYRIAAEFNDRPHLRGTLSMARASHPDSAGSQFFICVADAPNLDGDYTVFGEVLSGLEVADAIVLSPRDARDRPLQNIVMQSVTIEPAPVPDPELP